MYNPEEPIKIFIDKKSGQEKTLRDITGKRFNYLTAVEFQYMNKSNHSVWSFKCDCGKELCADTNTVKRNRRVSCGCKRYAQNEDITTFKYKMKHDILLKKVYGTWIDLRARCDNHKRENYINYGGRGISYCERWKKFDNFLYDMGYPPDKSYSIERIDVNGNYDPNNCKWATAKEQARNTRANHIVEYDGKTICLMECVEQYSSLNYHAVSKRLQSGWELERALTQKSQYDK